MLFWATVAFTIPPPDACTSTPSLPAPVMMPPVNETVVVWPPKAWANTPLEKGASIVVF